MTSPMDATTAHLKKLKVGPGLGPECNAGGDYFKKEEVEVKLFWAVWMDLATAKNNHAGPASEHDVDKFIEEARTRNPKLHFWKVPLGGQLPWRDELEMYEAYSGRRYRR